LNDNNEFKFQMHQLNETAGKGTCKPPDCATNSLDELIAFWPLRDASGCAAATTAETNKINK
jgi:hypothetical protein